MKLADTVTDDLDAWKLVRARDLREHIISENHDEANAGHLGVEKTYKRVACDYFWPGIYKDIERYVRHCEVCQTSKVRQKKPAGLMGRRASQTPWTVIAMDIMGPLPTIRKQFSYLFVIKDLFSRWIELIPLRQANGKEIIAKFEDHIICRCGTPEVLLTDNGTEFMNNVTQEMCRAYGIKHATVPPYHPHANPVERVNK